MRFALPVSDGSLAVHFGHCDKFVIIDIDPKTREIINREEVIPPPHEPGVLPEWLAGKNVNIVLAGGMGIRAQELFSRQNISVIAGIVNGTPEELVNDYLSGALAMGKNLCDH